MAKLLVVALLLIPIAIFPQTGSTGQILGIVRDSSGGTVRAAGVRLTRVGTNFERRVETDDSGRYVFSLLTPGQYVMEVSLSGFTTHQETSIPVSVSETTVVDVALQVGQVTTQVTVSSEPEMVQSTSSTLGRVVEQRQLVGLPLATRNYTQILALSPGVITDVANAGALGRNSLEISAMGGRRSDNNIQLNGADANNVLVTNVADGDSAQGVAVPAPDTIQEFKVQTALYDAATGRNGGANVNVVTKSGSNEFHGGIYEFFRNEALDANDFFRNRAGLPTARLRQNQFGGILGGPIRKDSTFFFISYEGNRQSNGVTGGATSSVFLPPLTNDRSPAALGRLFGGQKGMFGGVAVAADGSNIDPIALKLLNAKLPNGQFLIPTPQIVLPSGIGQSSFSEPAEFTENQFNTNLDQRFGARNTLSVKYFSAFTSTTRPFGGGASVPGFPQNNDGSNENATLSWTRIIRPNLINEARAAFTRLQSLGTSEEPIKASDLGIKTPPWSPGLPNIGFLTTNLAFGSSSVPVGSAVNNFQYSDSISYTHGRHTIRAGGEFKRLQANVKFDFDQRTLLRYFTFPDFLLSLPSPTNGASVPVGDIYVSSARSGLIGRAQRMSDLDGYFQDDIRVHPQLELNLGLRYEVYGPVTDNLGRMSNFELARAVPEPPGGQTFTGFVLAKNSIGKEPTGVIRLDRDNIINNDLNNFGPRVGLAYRPIGSKSFVIRSGYGAYFSRPGSVGLFQTAANLPFAVISTSIGVPNRGATLANPFDPNLPTRDAFPVFQPRTTTSNIFVNAIDPSMRAPTVHQWSFGTQIGFLRDFLLEAGYVGTRGTGLVGRYRFDQPLLASTASPVHGLTGNTLANAALRTPIQGLDPSQSQLIVSRFDSSYHALVANLSKRFGRGLIFMASYTWSHNIDDVADGQAVGDLLAIGAYPGDSSNFRLNRASADIDRRQRFVFNGYWELPTLVRSGGAWRKIANGWALASVLTLQSGLPLSVSDTAAGSIFSTTTSRAQLAPGATLANIELSGSVESKLNAFFRTSGFVPAPAIGDGFGFGNSARNLLRGPDQRNLDLSALKRTPLGWPSDRANIEFRAEFFNAFNTVNFGMPGSNRASPATFGVINSTTVAPRLVQLALKFNF